MSAQSGGMGLVSERTPNRQPFNALETANATKRQTVSRKRDVELVFPQPTLVESLIDSILVLVKPQQQIEAVQQINNRKFLITFRNASYAEHFYRNLAAQVVVSEVSPVCRWLGVERKLLRVSFLPCVVPNEELVKELTKFGRVLRVTDEVYPNKQINIKTGTRLIELEMISAVPNIVTVCGFSVPVTYKGVEIQCRRCLKSGHVKADCTEPFCDRCRTFGHASTVCSAPCLKCKTANHHWKDCSVRSYAFAATATEECSVGADITASTTIMNTAAEAGSVGMCSALADPADAVLASEGSMEAVGAAATLKSAATSATSLDATTCADSAHIDVTCGSAAVAGEAVALDADDEGESVPSGALSGRALPGDEKVSPVLNMDSTKPGDQCTSIDAEKFNSVSSKDKSKVTNFEWKTALTRSKRKQAVLSSGMSPCLKKSAFDQDLSKKN